MSTAIHRAKLPTELFSLSPSLFLFFFADWNSSISTHATVEQKQQQRQQDRTRGFHNRAIATRTLNKLIGNSIDDGSAAACPNTATCRFLAPGKRFCATTYLRKDHTVSCSQTEKLVPSRQDKGEAWIRVPISNEFDDLLNYFDVLVTLLLACLVECLVTNGFVQSSLHLIIRKKDEVDRRSKSEDETLTMQLFDTIFWYYDHSLRTTQMHPLINRVTIKKKRKES